MSYRFLSGPEWHLLRDARLGALSESPRAFLSSYEREHGFPPERWQDELERGDWLVGTAGDEVRAVLGATPEPDVADDHRYLSHLWVAPVARRSGIATKLVLAMLDHLRAEGVARAWLWVLDGNEPAHSLYRKLGFLSTGERQPLGGGRWEERLAIDLR